MLAMELLRRIGHGVKSLPSHVGYGAADSKLAVARCLCRVMLAMMLPRRLGRGVMSMPMLT
jgi:hypothetical protein